MCANQLHVSAIYNHHLAEQRTVYKKTVIQCNKIVRTRSLLKLVYILRDNIKVHEKRGLVKRLWKIIRVLKYLNIFPEKIIVVMKF